jgi:adenylosuccinate synthase
LLLSAGCAIDEAVLLNEVKRLGLPPERVVVDPRAILIEEVDREAEKVAAEQIASTGSGTGAALMRRMSRRPDIRLAQHSDLLRSQVRVESVAPLLHTHIDHGGEVIIEGTQGFGLSLLHGPHYPNLTARDTTASGFAMEVGLSPRQVKDIILVVRTFPIRVGGNSGKLEDPITWEEVRLISGAPKVQMEYTSVTRKVRRVGRFNMAAVVTACQYNRPTALAVMGLDRLDFRNYLVGDRSDLTAVAENFLRTLAHETRVKITWVGTGFRTDDAFPI